MKSPPENENGFTLIEVLITMLVLSVGLFGMLSILINSIKYNQSSVYRSIASQQVSGMAETLRSNPTALATSNAASGVAFASAVPAYTASCLTLAGCNRGTNTTSGFVQHTIRMWQDQLSVLLPNGMGTVCQDSTPNDGTPYSTPVNWQCDNAANAPYVVKVCWNESRILASSSVIGTMATGYWSSGGGLCTYTSL
jgi:type IV pilus assembly protein PilV